jgi:universal stress protein A
MAGKTLLVPVDFSPSATRALAVAKDLAKSLGAELVLLHTFEQPFTLGELSPFIVQQFYAEAVPAANKALEDLAKANGVTRTFFREGAAGPEIVSLAAELTPQFVVMGTHGHTKLRHLVTGSVAAYVIRHSPVPVVTVRDNE